ncbi:D-2-hydroxyglutarate dehydrogenase, mitochondrial-like isoform X1 [Rhagoletis pomonella]|uniref:D-2-hydroxyglutarate dehydrogenase, mitochondrial-like isoform X1 n=1 Tax=Rhagoletis pomonella TaxID=28610 RepID=UPI001784D6E6|nr:D-2-hydroxyglutarate dehydrogenase, mitochondrial-like isoform X1 [Rhagoletis pomonella]
MLLRSVTKLQTWVVKLLARTYSNAGIPELTQARHNVKRNPFADLEDRDIAFFESTVGSRYVVQEDLQTYNIDFWRAVRGNSKLVLKPGTTQEVSAILRYCNERKLAVCPQGGNTGVVGGSVPVFDEIILSMARLDKILKIDEITGIAACEAGCILENLDRKARELDFVVPLDLGAKASCHIGGNVSTNAGGLRVVRYGNLHGSVLGLEVVLANGEVLDLMSDFKKDNTGYHLKHLFIGAEGTLGVITKVSLLCAPQPQAQHLAFLGLPNFDAVLRTFSSAKRHLGEILSACEMIDAPTLQANFDHFELNTPIGSFPFYMLLETSGSNGSHDLEKINRFVEFGMGKGEIIDGTIASEARKMQKIWKLREIAPIALGKDGYCFYYDLSLPLREFYSIVDVLRERVGPLATRVTGFGHLGDSNLHLNVCCTEYTQELYHKIEPFIYEYTHKLRGSISAEHGIGFLKKNYLRYSKASEAIAMMRDVKKLLDPNGILNPYKVLN